MREHSQRHLKGWGLNWARREERGLGVREGEKREWKGRTKRPRVSQETERPCSKSGCGYVGIREVGGRDRAQGLERSRREGSE